MRRIEGATGDAGRLRDAVETRVRVLPQFPPTVARMRRRLE
jgi:hypothetical protein